MKPKKKYYIFHFWHAVSGGALCAGGARLAPTGAKRRQQGSAWRSIQRGRAPFGT